MLLSAVVAFAFRSHIRERKLTILIPYLFYIFFQEATLIILAATDRSFSNSIVYNIYRPVSALVFAYIYWNIPFMARYRKLIFAITGIYLFLAITTYFLGIDSIKVPSSYLTVARGLVITGCAVLFLFSYFNLENAEEEKFWHPLVWITAGLVIFYPVVTISLSFHKYLLSHDATVYGLKLYQVIPQVMSIFMYSCFSYAFYLCQRKN
jgi:hypothetical protein